MKTSSLKKIVLGCLLVTLSSWITPVSADAQNSVLAEGKTTYLFNPGTGETKLTFTRLSNYTYSNQKVHVALALTPKPYSGGTFKPNFAKYVGELPARTYSKPFSVSGYGSFPRAGTYHITIGVGVTNSQGGVTLVSFLRGQKVTLGRKAQRDRKASHRALRIRPSGTAITDHKLTVAID